MVSQGTWSFLERPGSDYGDLRQTKNDERSLHMKKSLRFLALAFLVVMMGWRLAAGAHRGWTQTSVARKTLDEITGIEAITYEKRFVPGLDFVTAAILSTALLVGASFLVRRHPPQNHR